MRKLLLFSLLVLLGCATTQKPVYEWADAFTYWNCETMSAPDSFVRLSTLRGNPTYARSVIVHEDRHAIDAYRLGCKDYLVWLSRQSNRAEAEVRAFCAQAQYLAFVEREFGGNLDRAINHFARNLASYGFSDIPDEGTARARLHAVCDHTNLLDADA